MSVRWCGDDAEVEIASFPRAEPRLPGSKSLANRLLSCAALADGVTRLTGWSPVGDVNQMRGALSGLGVGITESGDGSLAIQGIGGRFPADDVDIDADNAGTVMRFCTALACLATGDVRLDGCSRMRQRPIGGLVRALQQLGARIEHLAEEGFPPLRVEGRPLAGGSVTFRRLVSSQFVSALLMVAPYATSDVWIDVAEGFLSRPYVSMTVEVMRRMQVEVVSDGQSRYVVPGFQRYRGSSHHIEPDASAAGYFWAAAAISGGTVTTPGLGRDSLQGDVGLVDLLERMGCRVSAEPDRISVTGPPPGELRGVEADLSDMPDAVPALTVVALFGRGQTRLMGVGALRHKECDRLEALGTELRRLGAQVSLEDDTLTIDPPADVLQTAVDTYGDHRMAMSLALVGLRRKIRVRDAGCVAKSFPRFFEELARFEARD